MPYPTYSDEALRVVLRVRELLALRRPVEEIVKETGLAQPTVSNIKAGRKWTNPKVPITYFQFRKIQVGERCKNEECKNHPQILTKDDLCPECALLWLHKVGFLKIGDGKNEQQKDKDSPSS